MTESGVPSPNRANDTRVVLRASRSPPQDGFRKAVVVDARDVGATFAFALLQSGMAQSIVVVDARAEQSEGQALDLAHCLPFVQPAHVRTGTTEDYADAAVIVIAAGAKQKRGESRLNLLKRNATIVEEIAGEIADRKSPGVSVVVANPVHVLTHVALKRTNWPRNRIIGSGTVLDSARFTAWPFAGNGGRNEAVVGETRP